MRNITKILLESLNSLKESDYDSNKKVTKVEVSILPTIKFLWAEGNQEHVRALFGSDEEHDMDFSKFQNAVYVLDQEVSERNGGYDKVKYIANIHVKFTYEDGSIEEEDTTYTGRVDCGDGYKYVTVSKNMKRTIQEDYKDAEVIIRESTDTKLDESDNGITLNDIANKAHKLGYEVLDDTRDDEGLTILVYKPESTESDNFDDFNNRKLYSYLSSIPNVRYQIDNDDQSCLAIWLKESENLDKSDDVKTIEETEDYKLLKVRLVSDENMSQECIEYIDSKGKNLGTVSYTIYKNGEYHIYTIEVRDDQRRKGIATILMKALQREVGDNDIYFDTLTPYGKALLDKISDYDVYEKGKLKANKYKGRIKEEI